MITNLHNASHTCIPYFTFLDFLFYLEILLFILSQCRAKTTGVLGQSIVKEIQNPHS